MAERSLQDLVKEALEAVGLPSLSRWISWLGQDERQDNNVLVSTLTHDLKLEEDALVSLISNLKSCQSSGTLVSVIPADLHESLMSWLSAAHLPTFSQSSVGFVVSQEMSDGFTSLVPTSPLMENWTLLNKASLYYPLVALSGSPQRRHLEILERVNRRRFDGTKRFHEDYRRLARDIVHIWAMMLSHWSTVNAPASNTSTERPIKTEVDTTPAPIGGLTRKFQSVKFTTRARKRPIGTTLFDQGPVVLPPAKKVHIERVEIKQENILQSSPSYPSSWPTSITRRIDQIPRLQQLPDITGINVWQTFHREIFATTFGGPPQALEARWHRTARAKREMGTSGQAYLCGLKSDENPFLPCAPCAPGLIFRSPGNVLGFDNSLGNDEYSSPEPRTVIIRLESDKWLYVGEYVIRLSDPLVECHDLNAEQQSKWMPPYKETVLEREGMESPLHDETKVLEVFTMECVAYHVRIQRAIMGL